MDQECIPPKSIKELIQLHFNEDRVVPFPTKDSTVRASSFARLCPREEVIAALHKINRSENTTPDQNINFALGTAMHLCLQNEILPSIGSLYGKWACRECGFKYGGLPKKGTYTSYNPDIETDFDPNFVVKRPDKCTNKIKKNTACGSVTFEFEEFIFNSNKFKISGHPDGFLYIENRDGLGVVEAKSISAGGAWEVKKFPNFEHYIQAQIYLWFTGLKWACILYWDKGTFGVDGLIEHYIDRDDDTIQAVKDALVSIWSGIESGVLPDRICGNSRCDRAAGCAVRDLCFAEETDGKQIEAGSTSGSGEVETPP